MLPPFARPVLLDLDHVPIPEPARRLLELERAELAAVLGQPVIFSHPTRADDPTDRWTVIIDASVAVPRLTAQPTRRELIMTLSDPGQFVSGVDLLHTLAHDEHDQVDDAEATSYAQVHDRIRAEVANVFPSFDLRSLDWAAICRRYAGVRNLEGGAFWAGARRWVAELGDAHTQLIGPGGRHHPPYRARMAPDGVTLTGVPQDSEAWAAVVRAGDRIPVDDAAAWLSEVGATPQHHAEVVARRFLAMSSAARPLAAVRKDGSRRRWVETVVQRPAVVADGQRIVLHRFTPEVPDQLRAILRRLSPSRELVLDLRGNTGGNLVAAAGARRLFLRGRDAGGSIAYTNGRGRLTEPQQLTLTPTDDAWTGPLCILVDAMTYSAAEDFLQPLVGQPDLRIEGGPTGGGSGRPHSRALADGVRLSVSTAITYLRDGRPVEFHGIS